MIATGRSWIGGERGRRFAGDAEFVQHHRGGVSGGRLVGSEHDDRARDLEDRGALALGQAVVDAGRDRAELGRPGVGEEVLGARWQHQADDVTGVHAPGGESDRDLVGDAVEVGVRQ